MAVTDQGGGSALGYQGIQNSAAIAFNIFSSHRGQTDILYNTSDGIVKGPGGPYLDTSPVDITKNGPIAVTLTYDGTMLTETLADQACNTATLTYVVGTDMPGDIPTITGAACACPPGTGYIGFTGGTGGASAVQTISNFTFIEMPAHGTAILTVVGMMSALLYRRANRGTS
jgi:hypothetical protein